MKPKEKKNIKKQQKQQGKTNRKNKNKKKLCFWHFIYTEQAKPHKYCLKTGML